MNFNGTVFDSDSGSGLSVFCEGAERLFNLPSFLFNSNSIFQCGSNRGLVAVFCAVTFFEGAIATVAVLVA